MEKLRALYQSLKAKIQNWRRNSRVSPMFIQFDDFFLCNHVNSKLGYSVLPESRPNKKWHRINCIAVQVLSIMFNAILVVSLVKSTKDLTDASLIIAMENVAFIGVFGTIFLNWLFMLHHNYDRTLRIVSKLEQHYPHSGIDQLKFKTAKYLGRLMRFSKIAFAANSMILIQFTSMPFISQFYHTMIGSESSEWVHIVAMKWSFDTMGSAVYWPIFFIELWLLFVDTYVVVATDLLYMTLIHLVTMEANNLGEIIGEIDWDDEDRNGEKDAIEELKKLSDIHQQLLEVADELQDIFSPIMLVNVFVVIALMCLTAFLAAVRLFILFANISFNDFNSCSQEKVHICWQNTLFQQSLLCGKGFIFASLEMR
jgi:hypothetical protein